MEIVTLKQVYGELKKIERTMITKQEFESLRDTFEFMNNPDTIKQIAGSNVDVKLRKFKEVRSTKDLLREA